LSPRLPIDKRLDRCLPYMLFESIGEFQPIPTGQFGFREVPSTSPAAKCSQAFFSGNLAPIRISFDRSLSLKVKERTVEFQVILTNQARSRFFSLRFQTAGRHEDLLGLLLFKWSSSISPRTSYNSIGYSCSRNKITLLLFALWRRRYTG
jgi:hypothetical protein